MRLDNRNTKMEWPVENSGKLRHHITWLDEVLGQDTSGLGVRWVPSSPPRRSWADIEPMSADDTVKAGQDIGTVMAAVTVRYRSWIKDTMRFVSPNGTIWVIKAIQNVKEMNIWMILTCDDLGPYLP